MSKNVTRKMCIAYTRPLMKNMNYDCDIAKNTYPEFHIIVKKLLK